MKRLIYRLEVGVLLGKEDPEFEPYSHVYTKDFGFYDEDVTPSFSFISVKADGIAYVKDGADKTYAIITGDMFNLTEEQINEIIEEQSFGRMDEFGFKADDIFYFIYKDGTEIKTVIDKSTEEELPDRYLMTEDRIRIGSEICFEEDHMNAYVEVWFDVEQRFGLVINDSPNYVNIYADYYPDDDRLVVTCIVIHNDDRYDRDFEVKDLADSERELIIRLMNEQCKKENGGLDMTAAFKNFNEE